ncbi:MAG: 2-C-methyl-D-erythritol 2,4-cyclodiphosphate synthase [Acholeplasmatales bacterium]|nr:2-C-methyl-D-erythritol 2,4-cyclodiphosphate synthase [Acholeplasmatales bacterium]
MKSKLAVVLLMAGEGLRFGSHKTMTKINQVPLYQYSLAILRKFSRDVVLVVNQEDYLEVLNAVDDDIKVIIGGTSRGESSLNGIRATSQEWVLIHDAARPLITSSLISNLIQSFDESIDGIIVSRNSDSVIYNQKTQEEGQKEDYLIIETPQIFRRELILAAYYQDLDHNLNFADDLRVYLKYHDSSRLKFFLQREPNNKLTWSEDLRLIKSLLLRRDMRIGNSYDVHALVEGRELILGGITIPYHLGLFGVSDADCLSHAIGNAILGALGEKDLGYYFNDQDPDNKGIKSSKILKYIYNIMGKHGYFINNIDVMIILQAPKVAKYIDLMKKYYMKLLNINRHQIAIKATTNEYFGLIGEGQAIAVKCIISLQGDFNERKN